MSRELIGEFKGKITGYRNGYPHERTEDGSIIQTVRETPGVEGVDRATYWSMMAGPDALYGEGAGTLMSRTGEMAMYRATGTAKMKGPMPVWRGVLYFQSQTPKWSALNGIAVVYVYEIDENDTTHGKLWEWK